MDPVVQVLPLVLVYLGAVIVDISEKKHFVDILDVDGANQ